MNLHHKVDLSCFNPDSHALGIKQHKHISGLNIINVAGSHTMASITELPYHFIRVIQNVFLAAKGNYKVLMFSGIASPTTGTAFLVCWVLKKLGIRKWYLIIDWDDLWGKGGLTDYNNQGSIAVHVADYMETNLPRLADLVTVVSHNILNRAISIGINKKNIFYLPNGTTPNGKYFVPSSKVKNKYGLQRNSKVLCFVGRALWTFDYLIESIKIIATKFPNIKILYISPLDKIHLKKIKEYNLSNNIIYMGTQPYEALSELISISDIALLPRAGTDIEKANFPTRLCDYVAAGRPVVASSIGDEVELIIKKYKCGLLASPDNPTDFAEKVIILLKNIKLRKTVGENNIRVANKYLSWDLTVRKFHNTILNHV